MEMSCTMIKGEPISDKKKHRVHRSLFPKVHFLGRQWCRNRLVRPPSSKVSGFVVLLMMIFFVPAALSRQENGRGSEVTPPMGWNSWDSYGLTIRSAEVRANAQWMAAHLKQYGWKYIVVDEGWYLRNPESIGKSAPEFTFDANGLYEPAPNRFPSAQRNQGFKPLADYVHSLGLKFGIHIIRGIPREAVSKNLPVAGSAFHARDAADQNDLCYWQGPKSGDSSGRKIYWNSDNYGIADNQAGQAYYDSLAKLYASWGVDLIKVDCISNPYHAREIQMISRALEKSGRQIVLSLSPGPTSVDQADEVRRYAQMWRISNDIIDYWNGKDITPGIKDQFPVAATWAPYSGQGAWPDADMLPIGYLGPRNGDPRATRLTHDEVRTLLTLWSMLRSPLMIGGDLPSMDPWTTTLLTNPDVIDVDQRSTEGHQVFTAKGIVIWLANAHKKGEQYLAIFNIGDTKQEVALAWNDIQLPNGRYTMTDLWSHTDRSAQESLGVGLAPHACALYRLKKETGRSSRSK
jgi:alpha-galactosidase